MRCYLKNMTFLRGYRKSMFELWKKYPSRNIVSACCQSSQANCEKTFVIRPEAGRNKKIKKKEIRINNKCE